MLIFTDSDRKFLESNFKNANDLLTSTDRREVLDALYDLIDEKGFAPPDYQEYNDFGREAQTVYDRIYLNN